MRRFVFVVASIAVSALFLWLAVRDVPLGDVWDGIRQADLLWLLASLLMITVGLWLRAIRWRGLLDFRIPLRESFHIINITFLMNQLPLRAGEIARSLLATRSGVPLMTAATSVIVERLLDTVLVVVMLAVGVANLPDVPAQVTQTAALFGAAVVVAFPVMIFFARVPTVPHRILGWVLKILPFLKRLPLESLLDNVLDGLQPLTRWRSLFHATFWTIMAWVPSFLSFYALHRALGIDYTDIWLSVILGTTLASFSIAIPVTVAAVGPFEAALRLSGELAGVTEVDATSLGFLAHGMALIGYALWGVIGLVAMGVSFSEMFRAKDPAEEPPAP